MPTDETAFDTHAAVRIGLFAVRFPRVRVTREQLLVSAVGIPIIRLGRNDVECVAFRRAKRRLLKIDSVRVTRKSHARMIRLYFYAANTDAAFAAMSDLNWPCVWEESSDAA